MAIGTSGVSAPSMGQNIDASIYGSQNAPKSMGISDFLNLARDTTALQKEKALLQPSIEAGQAASRQAVAQADTAELENKQKHLAAASQQVQRLLGKKDLNREDIIDNITEHAKNFNTPPSVVAQAIAKIPEKGTPLDYHAYLASGLAANLSTQAQLDKLYPGGVLPGQLPSSYKPETQEQPKTTAQEPFSQPEKLSYPVPQAGQPRAQLPSEEPDRQYGEKVRTELTNTQRTFGTSKQNYDKLIGQAEMLAENTFFGGPAGTAERTLKAKIGTPEYQQLSKDLAKAQIADIQSSGGTVEGVAGQQLLAHANGSVVYDPKVLIDVARRNAANLENKNMQANGVREFTQKFGDANVKHFMSMWNKNSNDNSVFEMKYIFDRAKTPQEGAAQVAKYIKESGLTPEKRKELATKYLNLQKLETTGTL